MNLRSCHRLPKRPIAGRWHRAVPLNFYQTLLSFSHSTTIASRFHGGKPSRPGFPTLYFAEHQQLALMEVGALLGYGGNMMANLKSNASWAMISVDVSLRNIIDLTNKSTRQRLETTVQELTGDWLGYSLRNPSSQPPPPYFTVVPTQRLGQALHWAPGIEGILTYSAKSPTEKNLVVFPDKLLPGSYLQFQNPITGQIDTIS